MATRVCKFNVWCFDLRCVGYRAGFVVEVVAVCVNLRKEGGFVALDGCMEAGCSMVGFCIFW